MSIETTEDKCREIIVVQLGVDEDEVTEDTSIVDDLGADSLDIVEIVMSLEEKFGIEIPDEEVEKYTTFKAIVDAVREKIGE